MATETKAKGWGALVLCALIPFIGLLVSTIIVKSDYKATVVKNSGFHRDGYADVPTTYQVTASPHLTYTEAWAKWNWLIVIGWVIAVFGPVVYFYINNKQGKDPGWGAVLVFWAVGISLGIGIYSLRRGRIEYERTVSEKVYTANAGNLDALFTNP